MKKKLEILEKPELRNENTRIRVLMYGGQEVGKTYLTKILTKNLNCYNISGKWLSGDYFDFTYDGAENCDAIVIDDIPALRKKGNLKQLKEMLLNPVIIINRLAKGYCNLSYQSIFINTNLHYSELFSEEELNQCFDYVIQFENQNTFYDCCKKFQIPLKFL